jgi:hypothetical protein
VELAAAAGLDLAAAATMLELESGGGRNIFGHDAVPTAGTYTPGGPVTSSNYAAYKAAVRAGRAGRQGVGPSQITYGPYQDACDQQGGCWDWRTNARYGFGVLAGLIRSYGTRDGFRRYNGSGVAAQAYATKAMAKYATWQARLAGVDTTVLVSSTTSTAGGTYAQEGDTGARVAALQTFLNTSFPSYSHIDLGPQRYGPQTVAVVKEFQRRAGVTGPDATGETVGPRTLAALQSYGYKP